MVLMRAARVREPAMQAPALRDATRLWFSIARFSR